MKALICRGSPDSGFIKKHSEKSNDLGVEKDKSLSGGLFRSSRRAEISVLNVLVYVVIEIIFRSTWGLIDFHEFIAVKT
jgi:hypothetical protein